MRKIKNIILVFNFLLFSFIDPSFSENQKFICDFSHMCKVSSPCSDEKDPQNSGCPGVKECRFLKNDDLKLSLDINENEVITKWITGFFDNAFKHKILSESDISEYTELPTKIYTLGFFDDLNVIKQVIWLKTTGDEASISIADVEIGSRSSFMSGSCKKQN
jgi:hypothetical protein